MCISISNCVQLNNGWLFIHSHSQCIISGRTLVHVHVQIYTYFKWQWNQAINQIDKAQLILAEGVTDDALKNPKRNKVCGLWAYNYFRNWSAKKIFFFQFQREFPIRKFTRWKKNTHIRIALHILRMDYYGLTNRSWMDSVRSSIYIMWI